jgi:hypothetical protein
MIGILTMILTVLPGADPAFLRGDADGSGHLSITDPILVLQYAFQGGFSPIGCLDAADADDSGAIDLTDAVLLLGYLFQASAQPAEPFPFPGSDGTEDALDCQIIAGGGEGSIIVFCCDKSSSMQGAKWKRLQEEVVDRIAALGPGDRFAIVLFDVSIVNFPASGAPVIASQAMKEAAVTMVMTIATGPGSCTKPALIQSLTYANNSTPRRKSIIYLGDGRNHCSTGDEATNAKNSLAEVTARNTQGVMIHAICIGPADGSCDENWARQLSAQNGGEYTRIIE